MRCMLNDQRLIHEALTSLRSSTNSDVVLFVSGVFGRLRPPRKIWRSADQLTAFIATLDQASATLDLNCMDYKKIMQQCLSHFLASGIPASTANRIIELMALRCDQAGSV